MRQRERGATFLGMVVILFILGTALYAGLRLAPVYLEYMKVSRSLEQVKDENQAQQTNVALIKRSLERHWDVEDISRIGWKEIKIAKGNDGYTVTADYDAEQPFAGNLYLLVKFKKSVLIPQ
jgi:uncharacterized protein DUF4845